MICTFFGHSDAPDTIKQSLHDALVDLIENYGVTEFYVGNNGNFDLMVCGQLRQLSKQYPIDYSVVLAYLRKEEQSAFGNDNTIFPEGIETVPKRFAISWRNNWMLKNSDVVVTYITRSFGGAVKFADAAKRQGKMIVELGEPCFAD